MGLFSRREPKPDPIGDICRLLAGRPWEWDRLNVQTEAGSTVPGLRHLSGATVAWYRRGPGSDPLAWFSVSGAGQMQMLGRRDGVRVYDAAIASAAARVARPRVSFDDATKAMAKAVLEGDAEAARLLADWVMEHCGGTKGA